ncbi:MAG: hypothetical protein MH472_09185 [Bacteroidia bacterium]|nr:hypothetical protein [Bacteroidia bacterium]
MLLSLILLLYGLSLSYLIGRLSWAGLKNVFNLPEEFIPHLSIFPIIGLAAMSPIVGIYHLFFKIDLVVHFIFITLLLVFYKSLPKYLAEAWILIKKEFVLISLLVFGVLLSIVLRPGTGDIADYHLQAIQWAERYANIPGLGNFNRPLANNNWWFNLQALVGFYPLGVPSVYVGNSLFFISTFLWFFLSPSVSKAQQWMRYIFLLFMIMAFKTAFIGAVTPDIVITLTLYILLDIFILANFHKADYKAYLVLSVLFICWALTVKATAITYGMLCLPALFVLLKQKDFKSLVQLIGLACIFLVPWLVGNVIVSGYLLYPFHQIDLFNFDWKLPAEVLKFETFSIKSWGKVPFQDIYYTATLSIKDWLPLWFSKLDFLNKSLVVSFALSTPVLWILVWKRKEILWLILFVLLGFLVLFLNGPHPRFLFGYMVSTLALMAYVLAEKFPFHLAKPFLTIFTGVMVAFVLVQTVIKGDLQQGVLVPKAYPKTSLETINLNGFKAYSTPHEGICWDQFPSTYYMVPGTQLRTNQVEDGFKSVTTSF